MKESLLNDLFSKALVSSKNNLEPLPEYYKLFIEKVKRKSSNTPRGFKTHQKSRLSNEIMDL